MSLDDLVPVALLVDLKQRRLSGKESNWARQKRWRAKNLDAYNAYRRALYAKRKTGR